MIHIGLEGEWYNEMCLKKAVIALVSVHRKARTFMPTSQCMSIGPWKNEAVKCLGISLACNRVQHFNERVS